VRGPTGPHHPQQRNSVAGGQGSSQRARKAPRRAHRRGVGRPALWDRLELEKGPLGVFDAQKAVLSTVCVMLGDPSAGPASRSPAPVLGTARPTNRLIG